MALLYANQSYVVVSEFFKNVLLDFCLLRSKLIFRYLRFGALLVFSIKRITLTYDTKKRVESHLSWVPFQRVYTGSSRLHTSGSSRPSYLRFIQTVIPPVHLEFSYLRFIQISFIPLVHLDFFHTSGSSRTSYLWFIQILFIALVHLEHHTSGSSRPSYLWYIQSFHTSGSSRFHSYIWFIYIFFHTFGSSRTSYFWFIQIFFIPLVHLELHTSGSSRVFLPVSACKLHIRSKFGQI